MLVMRRTTLAALACALLSAACAGPEASTPTTATTSPTPQPTPTLEVQPPDLSAQPLPSPTAAPPTRVPSTTSASQRGFTPPLEVGIGDPFYPGLGNPGYDVEHYALDLRFDPGDGFLDATATIRAVATADLASFNLDFDRLFVTGVTVDGAPANFTYGGEELTVRPAGPAILSGEQFLVEVTYEGTPGPEESDAVPAAIGWFTSDDGSETFVVAEPDLAHTWFPSNDHPLDKATFTFNLTVPDELVAAANGTLVDTGPAEDGFTRWTWEMDDPMATYLATVVIGEFDIVADEAASEAAGVPIRHVLPRGTTVESWPGLERQGEMLAFMEDLFGPYPFDNYGIAIVDGFQNALENQTLSVFGRRFAESQIFDIVLVHELAHQWFGNSVSPGQWQDIWLNEGFASYAEWLWLERERGRQFVEDRIELERSDIARLGLRAPGDPLADRLFDPSVYRIGAMTLHALRLTVGDDAFFGILRTYHDRFAGGTAITLDFVAVAEEISAMDLGGLFDAWLYDPEIPEFP